MRPHKKLVVWQKSIDLVELVYFHTKSFPRNEEYGLTSQLRRAAVSVPANIAEGSAKNSSKDYARYLNIAQGSLSEVDTLIDISLRLNYIESKTHVVICERIDHVSAMLMGLTKKIKTQTIKKPSSF